MNKLLIALALATSMANAGVTTMSVPNYDHNNCDARGWVAEVLVEMIDKNLRPNEALKSFTTPEGRDMVIRAYSWKETQQQFSDQEYLACIKENI